MKKGCLKIIFLKVTSWTGLSIGAIHYYGKLVSYENAAQLAGKLDPITVQKTATVQEATEHNKWARQMDKEYSCIKAGDLIDGFIDEDTLRKHAVLYFKKHFPKSALLIEEENGTIDPNPVLDGPEKLVRELNKLNAAAEKIGRWDNDANKKAMRDICGKWNVLLKKQYIYIR